MPSAGLKGPPGGDRDIPRGPQGRLLLAGALGLAFLVALSIGNGAGAAVPLLGAAMGVTLFQGAVGFTGAYRRLFTLGDTCGLIAQIAMLAVATLAFAPLLQGGEGFGVPVSGAVAPVGVAMALGAFLFGIGMQLGGGCGSGTLYTAGGGDLRMMVTLVFFCLGGFWGSLDLAWWRSLPELPEIVLGDLWGYGPAAVFQVVLLAGIGLALWRCGVRGRGGPRPTRRLLLAVTALAVLNWLALAVTGHPWSITWGFTLWGAKAAELAGWQSATSPFWADGFPAQALAMPVMADVTSAMDLGILAGAFLAATVAGRVTPRRRIPAGHWAASVVGGLLLGYGARLAYGCNIGAFFSGVASTSLHGWAWIIFALPGNWLGVKLRRWFGLDV